jgi:DNA polymerase-3 subunit gamma/tau
LDQLASYGDDEITVAQVQAVLGTVSSQAIGKLVGRLVKRDVAGGLDLINQVVGDGADPRQFNRELIEYLRGLLLIKAGNGASLLNVTAEVLAQMENQAQKLSTKALLRTVRLFNQASLDLKASLQPQLPLELAFIEATLGEDPVTERGSIPEDQQEAGQEMTAAPPPSVTSSTIPREGQSVGGNKTTRVVAVDTSSQPSLTEETPTGREREPQPDSEVTLERVRLNWARILAEMRPHNRSAEALLRSGRAEMVEGNVVILGFPYAFHKERVEEPKCQAMVEQVFSRVLGSPCRIRCILVSKSSPKSIRSAQQGRQPLKTPQPEPAKGGGQDRESKEDKYRAIAEDPVVRAAVDKYGAQVVDVQ